MLAQNSAEYQSSAIAAFLCLVFLCQIQSVGSKGLSVEAWERQALQATDPDVDAFGSMHDVTRKNVAKANEIGSIQAWEKHALQATDPDIDAFGSNSDGAAKHSAIDALDIHANADEGRDEQSSLDGHINGLSHILRSDFAENRPRIMRKSAEAVPAHIHHRGGLRRPSMQRKQSNPRKL